MCGITGWVGGDAPLDIRRATTERMIATLTTRGPDDNGVHASPAGAIGMSRLSIIDLAGGHQPIANERGTHWVVQNGEIYNYRQLAAELRAAGHVFATQSDTEVLVHGYEQWGSELPTRLRGMYAFAIWVPNEKELFLAVDRAGIKPLYYAATPRGLIFGSELKALLASSQVGSDVDWQALSLFFAFGHIPAPHSVYSAARKLPPAHFLCWKDGVLRIASYWDLPAEDPGMALAGLDRRVVLELRDAVASHLVADVPVGAFLSGGLDSATVVALAAGASDVRLKTFTIGFAEKDFDERAEARTIANKYGTEHHELLVAPESVSVLPRILHYFDEPFADSSAVPTYYVSKLAREHVKVVLSGDGGDELLMGYKSFLSTWIALKAQRVPPQARSWARAFLASLPEMPGFGLNRYWTLLRQRSIDCLSDPVTTFVNKQARVGRSLLLDCFSDDFRSQLDPTYPEQFLTEIIEGRQRSTPNSTLEPFAYATYRFSLPSNMLVKVDRMSMLNSLEVRVPLLDHRLTELLARIPISVRMPGGRLKGLLRRVARPFLTEAVLNKRKTGFAMPLALWFKDDLEGYLMEALGAGSTQGLLRPQAVERLLARLRGGDERSSATIWTLLAFEVWRSASRSAL
jgi:asparagine synthase (glutamine-hydrolysing)